MLLDSRPDDLQRPKAAPIDFTRAAGLAAFAVVVLGANVGHASVASAAACTRLDGMTIPAGAIGEPTSGARARSAKLVPAIPAPTGTSSGAVAASARPEHCEITGEIKPVDPTAPPILFQVNLPSQWNGKVLQMGGFGFDGSVVTGLGQISRAPASIPPPFARGYVTFGSDSGHEGNDASFAVNAEAMVNFGGAQLKKTHDVALALVKERYGKRPDRTYFIGQSEGGREGLVAVQRYPRDYDGVAVTAPAVHFSSALMRFNAVGSVISRSGGFLTPGKLKAFASAVLAQCDMNDGVADGIVGNYLGCEFDRSVLRCPGGVDAGDVCLSDPQLAGLQASYGPMVWRDGAGKVIAESPRYLMGGGEDKPGALQPWIFGRVPPPLGQPAEESISSQKLGVGQGPSYAVSGIRYMIARNPTLNTTNFDPKPYAERIREIEKILDAANPDISAFRKRGGKLIILHNTSDAANSPVSSMNYYDAVERRLGKAAVQSFLRLYIVPGGGHGGDGDVATKVDMLGMLDGWATKSKAPGHDWIAEEDGPDAKPVRTKPLCAYPYYPRYSGSGDPSRAASYSCVVSRPG